jgi:hypothetical protein
MCFLLTADWTFYIFMLLITIIYSWLLSIDAYQNLNMSIEELQALLENQFTCDPNL